LISSVQFSYIALDASLLGIVVGNNNEVNPCQT